ncbi:hypothetical protein SAMN04244548_04492 [Paracoccus pantotrophus]|nr:hypothetical protein SAMN04244548_04492 [Paracoccus pantotrophus]
MRRRCSACRTYAAVYEAALEEAELHAITITDNSRDPGPDEPTAEDIARFALDRVRAVNATISQIEDDCMRGAAGIGNNPVRAMECLTMPAVWAGQKGFASELVSITKLSCAADAAGFPCYFQRGADRPLRHAQCAVKLGMKNAQRMHPGQGLAQKPVSPDLAWIAPRQVPGRQDG